MPNHPRPTSAQVPGGRGAADPQFAPQGPMPGSGRQNQIQAQPTQFDRLREVLLGPGRAAISALRSQINAERQMENLRVRASNRHQQMLNAYHSADVARSRGMQQQRLKKTQADVTNMLSSPNAENPQWLMRHASINMNNAATTQERMMWFQVFERGQKMLQAQQVDAEKQQRREAQREMALAAETADNVVQISVSELQQNPQIKQELIGNGQNIPERTQEWILGEAAEAAPELFNIDRNDPLREEKEIQRDNLVQQLIQRSIRVADSLIREHTTEVHQAHRRQGEKNIQAVTKQYISGDMDFGDFLDQIVSISEDHFGDMTPTQRAQIRDQYILEFAGRIGRIEGDDVQRAVQQLTELTEAFPHLESKIRQQAEPALNQALISQLDAHVENARRQEGLDRTIRSPQQAQMVDQLVAEAANELKRSAGIPSEGDLTPAQRRVQRTIDTAAQKLRGEFHDQQRRLSTQEEAYAARRTGRSYDGNRAWNGSIIKQGLSQEGIDSDSPVWQDFVNQWNDEYARSQMGERGIPELPWRPGDGPLDWENPDHVQVFRAAAIMEARDLNRHSDGTVPKELADDMTRWLNSDNANQVTVASEFFFNLDGDERSAFRQKVGDKVYRQFLAAAGPYNRIVREQLNTEQPFAERPNAQSIIEAVRMQREELQDQVAQDIRESLRTDDVTQITELASEAMNLYTQFWEDEGYLPKTSFAEISKMFQMPIVGGVAKRRIEKLRRAFSNNPQALEDDLIRAATIAQDQRIGLEEAVIRVALDRKDAGERPVLIGRDSEGDELIMFMNAGPPGGSHMIPGSDSIEDVIDMASVDMNTPFMMDEAGTRPSSRDSEFLPTDHQRQQAVNLVQAFGLTQDEASQFLDENLTRNTTQNQLIARIIRHKNPTIARGLAEDEWISQWQYSLWSSDPAEIGFYSKRFAAHGGGFPFNIQVDETLSIRELLATDVFGQGTSPFVISGANLPLSDRERLIQETEERNQGPRGLQLGLDQPQRSPDRQITGSGAMAVPTPELRLGPR